MRKRTVTALFTIAFATAASADGASTFSAQCASCHGSNAKGTKLGPPIAGKPAGDVKHAIEVGGGREHKPGTKWKMKPVKVDDVDAVASYVSGLKI